MSASNFLENAIMDHIFGKANYAPGMIAIGLGVATDDTDANELAEINNYARVVLSSSDWTTAVNGRIENALSVSFPQATGGAWGVVTHFILFNSGTYGAGQMILSGGFAPELNFVEDAFQIFLAGELEITLD